MKSAEIRTKFLAVLRGARPRDRAVVLARARERPDAALHQLRDGAVQGRVPRQGIARLQARHHRAALRARRRQAQRPRERGLHRAPPHVLRDARQLQLRRLLQARRDPLRLGAAHQGLQAAGRPAVGHRLPHRRRGLRGLVEGDRGARRPHRAHRRQARRDAVPERQLLADGRHRPVRAVLARSSTTTAPRCPAGRPARPRPTATATSRSGTSSSCSSTGTSRAGSTRCRSPRSTPAWGSSGSPRCCRACTRTTRSTSSRT